MMTLGTKLAVCMCIMFSFTYGNKPSLDHCDVINISHEPGGFHILTEKSSFRLACSHSALISSMIPTKDVDIDEEMINVPSDLLRIAILDFAANQIESIPAFNFSFASHIKNISFAHNHIKVVPEGVCSTFNNLKNLNLSSNLIRNSLSDSNKNGLSIFSRMPASVTTLDLSFNPIMTLNENNQISNFEKLYLSHCSISSISKDAFFGMNNLIYLDLSHNIINTFDERFLSLQYLDLGHNVLTSMPPPNHRVRTLLLSNNRIASIPEHSFSNMGDLVTLSLAHNRLTDITNTSLPLHRFHVLELQGNPWDCCKLRWMTSSKMKKLGEEQFFFLPCNEPPELKNRDIFSLTEDQLSCNSKPGNTLSVIIICGILAGLILVGSGVVLYRKRRKLRRRAKGATANGNVGGQYVAVYSQDMCEDDTGKVAISDKKPLVSMANNTSVMINV